MKAVFLDYQSLDKQDLDFSGLEAQFDDLTLYPVTTAAEVAQRIQEADVIISNKVHINAEHMQLNPQLKLILIFSKRNSSINYYQIKETLTKWISRY